MIGEQIIKIKDARTQIWVNSSFYHQNITNIMTSHNIIFPRQAWYGMHFYSSSRLWHIWHISKASITIWHIGKGKGPIAFMAVGAVIVRDPCFLGLAYEWWCPSPHLSPPNLPQFFRIRYPLTGGWTERFFQSHLARVRFRSRDLLHRSLVL